MPEDFPPDHAPAVLAPPPAFYNFDRVARDYEATRYLPPWVAQNIARFVLQEVSPQAWFLDAGVGTGRVGRAIVAQHPGRTLGVDVSGAMLGEFMEACAQDRINPAVALADVRALPFKSGAFGAILSIHVLHLVADWRTALAEMWRVVAPGGTLFIGVEDRTRTVARQFYLSRARELGVLPPTIGAHTADVIAALPAMGAEAVKTVALPDARWEQTVTARDAIAHLERRLYSMLWDVPEETHQRLLTETRAHTLSVLGTLDATERRENQMILHAARKPTGA